MGNTGATRWWNFIAGTCTAIAMLVASLLGVHCGELGDDTVTLGVPYRAQTNGCLDCAPASILMWRLFDGRPQISLSTIGSYIGTTCNSGTLPEDIADGVNHFTFTNDTFWDVAGGTAVSRDKFMSRQITSIDRDVPVLAIVNDGFHIGALNGGKWHENANGDNQWDLVKFHDPLPNEGPNREFSGTGWIFRNCGSSLVCQQIASSSAMAGWLSNYNTYNGQVVLGGGGGGPCGGPCDQQQ